MEELRYIQNDQIELSNESIKFWANKLNCTEKELRDSINKIGNNVNVLSMFLEMNYIVKK